MAVLHAISHLLEINPTDANGQYNSNGWQYGNHTSVVVEVRQPHNTSSGSCALNGDYYPVRKQMDTIEDITGDGYYPNNVGPGPQPVVGNSTSLYYVDDGSYWSPTGSTYGSGIPAKTKERTYERHH